MMRFKVTGYDDEGDRHTFETDDEERARCVFDQFREDLSRVEMTGTDVEREDS